MTPCPVCKSDALPFWRERECSAARCAECEHVFSEGARDAAVYEADYFERWYLAHRDARLAYFVELIDRHGLEPRAPLLDVGAGVGLWLEVCRGLGLAEATAVEPSEYGRARLAELRDASMPSLEIRAALGELEGRAGRYRTVTVLDVLSHVDDLRGTLEAIRRLLAPDGQLIVKAPNHAPALFRAARWLAPLGRGRALLCVRSQQHHFAPDSLPGLLARFGFRTRHLAALHEAPPRLLGDPRSWALNRVARLAVGSESMLWIGTPDG